MSGQNPGPFKSKPVLPNNAVDLRRVLNAARAQGGGDREHSPGSPRLRFLRGYRGSPPPGPSTATSPTRSLRPLSTPSLVRPFFRPSLVSPAPCPRDEDKKGKSRSSLFFLFLLSLQLRVGETVDCALIFLPRVMNHWAPWPAIVPPCLPLQSRPPPGSQRGQIIY